MINEHRRDGSSHSEAAEPSAFCVFLFYQFLIELKELGFNALVIEECLLFLIFKLISCILQKYILHLQPDNLKVKQQE